MFKKEPNCKDYISSPVRSHQGTSEELAEIERLIADKIQSRHGFIDDGTHYRRSIGKKWKKSHKTSN